MSNQNPSLIDWLRAPDKTRGGRFTRDGEEWVYFSYLEMALAVRRLAARLHDRGVGVNDTLPIILPAGSDFVAAFYATLVIGAVPAPIAPPMVFQDRDAYRRHLRKLLDICSARLIVADQDLVDLIGPDEFSSELLIPSHDGASDDMLDIPPTSPGSFGLLQFTSGSSGHIRGVQVPVGSLEANVNAIRRWTRTTRDDLGASWLPVHHDMGLIGNLLMAVGTGMSWWLMRPEHFIADPMRWLRLYGEHGACLGAAPNFGLGYVTRRVQPSDLDGMDFSNWRALVCGAERVDKDTIDGFCALLEPAGFDRRAVLPAYGLAEATLAVSGKPLTAEPRALRVGSTQSFGEPVEVLNSDRDDRQWLMGCGRPVDEQTVITIVDTDGRSLPAGHLGEIAVEGPSVTAGYAPGSSESPSTRFEDGRLITGDAGFLLDDELFVVGRFGDSLKVRGKSIFAEDVDGLIHQIDGLGPHNSVSLLGILDGSETVVAIIEESDAGWLQDVVSRLRKLDPDIRVQVYRATRGTIRRTTSGKPRRRPMWDSITGNADISAVYDSATTGATTAATT